MDCIEWTNPSGIDKLVSDRKWVALKSAVLFVSATIRLMSSLMSSLAKERPGCLATHRLERW